MSQKRRMSGSQVFGFDASSYRSALKRPRASATGGSFGRKTINSSVVSGKGGSSRRKVSGLSSRMKAAISLMIENKKEQKLQSAVGAATLILTDGGVAVPAFYSLIPQIGQGAAENQRIGDQINVSKNVLKIHLEAATPTALGPSGGPQIVTLWIGKLRSNGTPGATAANQLLTLGGVVQGFSSTSDTDFMLPVFEDIWDIKVRKEYKIGWETSFPSNVTSTASYHQTDFLAVANDEFDVTRWLKKTVMYNDATTASLQDTLYVFFTVYNVLGAATTTYPNMSYSLVSRFTDA